MSYLLIPNMHVQTANVLHSSFLVGGPPVMAAFFFAHAMGRQLGKQVQVSAVAYIHHHRQVLGEQFGRTSLQQRRGAAFTFSNKPKKDYSSKNEHALSLQPVANAHLRLSLIIEIERLTSVDSVSRFLYGARFSGGQIISHDTPVRFDELEDALDKAPDGFYVLDRSDLMQKRNGKNQAETLVAQLGANPKCPPTPSWLSAACLGYAMLTPFADRQGAREGYRHAFAEPLIGLVQYQSSRQFLKEREDPSRESENMRRKPESILWKSEWLQNDVYRLYQENN